MDDVVKFLETNFSEESYNLLKTQMLLLNKKSRGCRYSNEFKQFALSVFFLGPKAYKKFSTVFPLPSKSTLNRFTQRWVIDPGFNEFVFRVIECRVRLLKEKERDCILCIDEISLKSHLYYDVSKDKIIGTSSGSSEIAGSALAVMARGIASNWKQPVAYFFYKTSAPVNDLKDILFETIRRLRKTGLNVFGVVSDQGSNFQKLVKSTLKVTEDNPTFFVDDENLKLVYLFDIPHLLKSTRNNFYSYIFSLNERKIKKRYLEMMYDIDKTKQYKLAHRLTNDHIYPNNFQKMKVKLASQVFSHSVAVAMHTYIEFNVLPKEATATAHFISKMNDLFDLLNSNNLQDFRAFMGTDKQKTLLQEMHYVFQNINVLSFDEKNVTNKLKFLSGWRLTIKSILLLWEILQAKGYKYLFTRNLNQDCIENFFGQIRNCCGNSKNPTPIQFCRSFKKIFALGYLDNVETANCIDDGTKALLNLTPEFVKSCNNVCADPTYSPLRVFTNDYVNLKSPEGNALVYVTGYLIKKCLTRHSCDVCINFANDSDTLFKEELFFCKLKAYENEIPFGGLTVPSRDIIDYILKLESIFVTQFNNLAFKEAIGTQLRKDFSNIVFKHPCNNFPFEYFLDLYTRVRIYYTLKFINIDIKTAKSNKNNIKLNILKNL